MKRKAPNTRLQAPEKPRTSNVGAHSFVILLALIIFSLPNLAHAHGELLIRIGAVSREIATNATPQLYLDRGELYRQDQNWEASEADYSQAARLGVKLDTVDFCRAQLRADRGQFDAAKAILDKVILRSPEDGQAVLARAHVLVRLGARGPAIADFERGFKLVAEPGSDSFLEWAQTLAAENRVVEALSVLDRGIVKFGPGNALQVYAMDLEIGRKRTDAALARLETIIQHADRKERWLARRGDIQLSAGKPVEARQSYEAALAAIRHLPAIIQKSPPMLNLKSQIDAALAGIDSSDATKSVGRASGRSADLQSAVSPISNRQGQVRFEGLGSQSQNFILPVVRNFALNQHGII